MMTVALAISLVAVLVLSIYAGYLWLKLRRETVSDRLEFYRTNRY